MCTAPPPGGLRVTPATTCSVSCLTVSRMRLEAAPERPSTSRNALVRATSILLASNGVTLPLRRMTL